MIYIPKHEMHAAIGRVFFLLVWDKFSMWHFLRNMSVNEAAIDKLKILSVAIY